MRVGVKPKRMVHGVFSAVLLVSLLVAGHVAAYEVVVSIPPQQYFVERIAADRAEVHVLVGPGQSPHTYEPTPRQVEMLGRARAYFSIGLPFEKVLLEKILVNNRQLVQIATDQGIVKRQMGEDRGETHSHQHDGVPEHAHGAEGERDPHIWLSPRLITIQAGLICEGLIKLDPDHTEQYRANVARFIAEVANIDLQIAQVLGPLKGRSVYVYHPAFGYLIEEYGLKQVAIEIEGKSPTPRAIADLIVRAKAENIRVIFVQKQFDAKSAMTIARALSGAVVSLDPLAKDVLGNLTFMVDEIRKALIPEHEHNSATR